MTVRVAPIIEGQITGEAFTVRARTGRDYWSSIIGSRLQVGREGNEDTPIYYVHPRPQEVRFVIEEDGDTDDQPYQSRFGTRAGYMAFRLGDSADTYLTEYSPGLRHLAVRLDRWTIPATLAPVTAPGLGMETRQPHTILPPTYWPSGAGGWYNRGEEHTLSLSQIRFSWMHSTWRRIGPMLNLYPFYLEVNDVVMYAWLTRPARPVLTSSTTYNLSLTIRTI